MRIFHIPYRFVVWFKKIRRRNKTIVIISAIIVATLIVWRIRMAAQTPPYLTEPVKRETIVQEVSETGHVQSSSKTDVYSPATGIVQSVFVQNNDPVVAGTELFTIKSTATEQEKAQALAAYLTAKNTLDTAQATMFSLQSAMFTDWRTFKELAEGDAYENADGTPRHDQRGNPQFHIAEKDWLAAESNYKKQQTVITQAQVALNSSYLLYQATQNSTVKATADGIVANLRVAAGDAIRAKTATSTPDAPVLLIIARDADTVIRLPINEVDIPKIRPGQQAEITLDAVPGTSFTGTVTTVDMVGTADQGIVTYTVFVSLPDSDPSIRPGMTGNVDIQVDKAENVLVVPNSAIKPYQGKKAVQVIDPNTKELRYVPVEIGRKSTEKTEIVSGISEGQNVISGTKNGAVNGDRGGFLGR